MRRDAVLAWREGLLGLAQRLEASAEVNPCGVARAQLVVTDGTGPLYSGLSEMTVGDAVWWIADGLGYARRFGGLDSVRRIAGIAR